MWKLHARMNHGKFISKFVISFVKIAKNAYCKILVNKSGSCVNSWTNCETLSKFLHYTSRMNFEEILYRS